MLNIKKCFGFTILETDNKIFRTKEGKFLQVKVESMWPLKINDFVQFSYNFKGEFKFTPNYRNISH